MGRATPARPKGRRVTQEIGEIRHLAVAGIGRSGTQPRGSCARVPGAAVVVLNEQPEAGLGAAPAELRVAGAAVLLGEPPRRTTSSCS